MRDIVYLILCQGSWCHCSSKVFSLYNPSKFLVILYPNLLADLVFEVGTRHSHKIQLVRAIAFMVRWLKKLSVWHFCVSISTRGGTSDKMKMPVTKKPKRLPTYHTARPPCDPHSQHPSVYGKGVGMSASAPYPCHFSLHTPSPCFCFYFYFISFFFFFFLGGGGAQNSDFFYPCPNPTPQTQPPQCCGGPHCTQLWQGWLLAAQFYLSK